MGRYRDLFFRIYGDLLHRLRRRIKACPHPSGGGAGRCRAVPCYRISMDTNGPWRSDVHADQATLVTCSQWKDVGQMGSELQVTTTGGDEETDHSPLGVSLCSAPATRPEQSAKAAFLKDTRNGCSLSRLFQHPCWRFMKELNVWRECHLQKISGAGNGQLEETVRSFAINWCLDLIRLRCWDAWCSWLLECRDVYISI